MLLIPTLALWGVVRASVASLAFHEDNNIGTKCVCESGKNPTMCHLERMRCVNVAWLWERCQGGQVRMIALCSSTKGLTDSQRRQHARYLINVGSSDELWVALRSVGGSVGGAYGGCQGGTA